MTRDEILAMGAGDELDDLVVIHLFNWAPYDESRNVSHECYYKMPNGYMGDEDDRPKFSTDIAAAWAVVDPQNDQRWYYDISSVICGGWIVQVYDEQKAVATKGDGSTGIKVMADTAPLAICRAALLTVLL